MLVAVIAYSTAERIKDQQYNGITKFNPIEDAQGRYIVSLVEAQYLNLNDIISIEEFEPIQNSSI